ncbi:MAG: ribose 5-phosphate isomerase B [Marinilabiliales bacterium]|nr:MAG: ribose 5-phosphate isomerase B [Marinilabiliales bacterium]
MTNSGTVLAMASDHGGFEMKEFIKAKLIEEGYEIKDFGTNSTESVDYPDIIHPAAKAINDGEIERGIIFCGSGNGAQMTANSYPNVRAGLCWTVEQAKLIRQHNNANIISIPGRFVSLDEGLAMAEAFLNTDFEGGRHLKRVEKINQIIK